jgi:iron(III) transport system permease protein
LVFSGSALIIIYACTVRFLAIAHGSIEAGHTRLSSHVSMVARTLGRSAGQTFVSVELPLLRRAIATAALLVFVDTMKELSATILLRPFNFPTLATHVYELASRARFEDAAMASLLIVAIGAVPVLALSRLQGAATLTGFRQ